MKSKLDVELAAFETQRSYLLRCYRGLFVAIHRGVVIDVDKDDFELAQRIEDLAIREGAIAICRVCELCEEKDTPERLYADFESASLEW